jgi:hypothetical protein
MEAKRVLRAIPYWLKSVAAVLVPLAAILGTVHQMGWLGKQPSTSRDRPSSEVLSPGPATVMLRYPLDKVTLSQPYELGWRFAWDEPTNIAPANIQQYHLLVTQGSAQVPVVDLEAITSRTFTHSRPCSYIVDRNLSDWRWKVRVRYKSGEWGPWSAERTFNVHRMDMSRLCSKCPQMPQLCGPR